MAELSVHAEVHHSPAVEMPREPANRQLQPEPEPELVPCPFCYLGHAASEIAEHADYCGSRTERCDSCFRFVQLRYFAEHSSSGCSSLDADDRSSFPSLQQANAIDRRSTERSSHVSFDGSGGTSPLDTLIGSGSSGLGDDGMAVCPYCDEGCEAAEGEDRVGGAAAALARHLAATDCAAAYAMQQLTGPWKARAEYGHAAQKATKKATKKAAAAARRKQQHLAAEYEAQAIHMFSPPCDSPMGSLEAESAMPAAAERAGGVSVGRGLGEAHFRAQEERMARLTTAGDEPDGGEWELIQFPHEEEEKQEPAEANDDADMADEESRGMARYYQQGQRAVVEPEMASFYSLARQRKDRADDVQPQDLFGAECECEFCGRAVGLAELEDHTVACQLRGNNPVDRSPELWMGGFETLSPATISVHRSQYDNGGGEGFSRRRSVMDQELRYHAEMETGRGGGGRRPSGGKKAKGKKVRRRGGGGLALFDEPAAEAVAMADAAESTVDAQEGASKKGKKKGRNGRS